MKPLIQPLSLLAILVLLVSKSTAATLYSTAAGSSDRKWSTLGSWTYNSNGTGSCGCIPGSGDVIYIRVNDSISVPTNINVAGNTTTHIYGELNITGFLDLAGTGSVVNIYTGGQLTSNGSASSKLRIGGTSTAEYSGNDGDLSGPWTISNGSSGPNVTLPVVLTSFTGTYANASVTLTWSTAQEINNDYFEIQKSTDGETFFALGQLNSSNTGSYSFTDDQVSSTVNYYRLLQTDINGVSTYSSIIKVSAVNFDFVVYPNPAVGNEFGIQFSSAQTGTITIQHANGNQVYSHAIGVQSFLSGQEIPALSPGVYFVLMNDGINQSSKKIIIK